MDVAAIGDGIADLFADLVPPAGYTAIQKVSSKRQLALGKLPAVVISWVTTRDVSVYNLRRWATVDYTATLYLPKIDAEKDDAALQAWHDVVIDALLPRLQLDQWASPNGVYEATVVSVTPGEEQLGEPYYAALEAAIEVKTWHPVTVSA